MVGRDSDVYNLEAFERAMSVVLAHAAYLPSAACFALLPLASQAPRTGAESGALLDYDLQRERVTISATRPYRCRSLVGPCNVDFYALTPHRCNPPEDLDARWHGGLIGILKREN